MRHVSCFDLAPCVPLQPRALRPALDFDHTVVLIVVAIVFSFDNAYASSFVRFATARSAQGGIITLHWNQGGLAIICPILTSGISWRSVGALQQRSALHRALAALCALASLYC